MFLLSFCTSGFTNIEIKLTVTASPQCIINNDRPIEVDFGDAVITTSVDGFNYREPINFSLKCNGDTTKTMNMMILGAGADFNENNLKTSKENLSIALYSKGTVLALNKSKPFIYSEIPTLEAVLVKQSGKTLTEGIFTATATMQIGYE